MRCYGLKGGTGTASRKPGGPLVFGYSYGIGPFTLHKATLPLPPIPTLDDLHLGSNWRQESARRVELASKFALSRYDWQVLSSGRRVAVAKRPRRVAALAPVYDSRGDIAGLVEAVTQQPVDPLGNVK